jgi:hypothetical protein
LLVRDGTCGGDMGGQLIWSRRRAPHGEIRLQIALPRPRRWRPRPTPVPRDERAARPSRRSRPAGARWQGPARGATQLSAGPHPGSAGHLDARRGNRRRGVLERVGPRALKPAGPQAALGQLPRAEDEARDELPCTAVRIRSPKPSSSMRPVPAGVALVLGPEPLSRPVFTPQPPLARVPKTLPAGRQGALQPLSPRELS